jgi:hypothetical protein
MEKKWFSSNIETEIAGYPETGKYIVINNSDKEQTTTITGKDGTKKTITLQANGSQWFDFAGNKI